MTEGGKVQRGGPEPVPAAAADSVRWDAQTGEWVPPAPATKQQLLDGGPLSPGRKVAGGATHSPCRCLPNLRAWSAAGAHPKAGTARPMEGAYWRHNSRSCPTRLRHGSRTAAATPSPVDSLPPHTMPKAGASCLVDKWQCSKYHAGFTVCALCYLVHSPWVLKRVAANTIWMWAIYLVRQWRTRAATALGCPRALRQTAPCSSLIRQLWPRQ
jgi:hypothetical protein